MKPKSFALPAVIAGALWFSASGAAQAQFTQPPRNPPPTCDRMKETPADILKSDCKAEFAQPDVEIMLACDQVSFAVACAAVTVAYVNGQWQTLDPATLTHQWSYILAGDEHHFSPGNMDQLSIGCQRGAAGHVRVAAGGAVAQTEIGCPSQITPDW